MTTEKQDCPRCGNNRQVWVNQITGKLTCHRAWCQTVISKPQGIYTESFSRFDFSHSPAIRQDVTIEFTSVLSVTDETITDYENDMWEALRTHVQRLGLEQSNFSSWLQQRK